MLVIEKSILQEHFTEHMSTSYSNYLLCNWPLVNIGNFDTICLTVSDRAKPAKALQANVLIQSASVIGVLTFISWSKTLNK